MLLGIHERLGQMKQRFKRQSIDNMQQIQRFATQLTREQGGPGLGPSRHGGHISTDDNSFYARYHWFFPS
jgi:hypothetical protein